MKKAASLFVAVLLLCSIFTLPAQAMSNKSLISTSAVLMDADTGEVLLSINRNKKMYPASITKIMTGLLVVENTSPDEMITVKESATKIPRGYAHMGLTAGEKLPVRSAMYAVMLASSNDAANAVGEHVAGSQQKFVKMMNERAEEIGATNTRFSNTYGFTDKNHYTTAYDMALITREAANNKDFMRYFGAETYTIPATSKQKALKVSNHQKMLLTDEKDYYNSDVVGGKIGYTYAAQHTMSTVATRDGHTLICVVMGSTTQGKYTDTERMLEYGFSLLNRRESLW